MMKSIYDKLNDIFEINEQLATESVASTIMKDYEVTVESIDDIDLELKIATESYIESEAQLIGFVSTLNQHIYLESVSEIDLDFDITDEMVVLEATEAADKKDDKEKKGFFAKIGSFFKMIIDAIVSFFKLLDINSLRMLKLNKVLSKYVEKLEKIQKEASSEVKSKTIKVLPGLLDETMINHIESELKEHVELIKSIAGKNFNSIEDLIVALYGAYKIQLGNVSAEELNSANKKFMETSKQTLENTTKALKDKTTHTEEMKLEKAIPTLITLLKKAIASTSRQFLVENKKANNELSKALLAKAKDFKSKAEGENAGEIKKQAAAVVQFVSNLKKAAGGSTALKITTIQHYIKIAKNIEELSK